MSHESSSMLPVTNLLSVSHVLYDHALAKLRKENASLRLKLFWKDYNLKELIEAMVFANNATGPKCVCTACVSSGRIPDYMTSDQYAPCTFKQWFESHLASLGMETKMSLFQGENKNHICLHGKDVRAKEAGVVFDDDTHFSHYSFRDNWTRFTYGSKLWAASNVNDPELLKLKSLFGILRKEEECA